MPHLISTFRSQGAFVRPDVAKQQPQTRPSLRNFQSRGARQREAPASPLCYLQLASIQLQQLLAIHVLRSKFCHVLLQAQAFQPLADLLTGPRRSCAQRLIQELDRRGLRGSGEELEGWATVLGLSGRGTILVQWREAGDALPVQQKVQVIA